jgi:VWFA-related protein
MTRRQGRRLARVALAVGLLSASAVITGQQATFRSAADAVRVDVLVTNDGRPVVGLKASDFEVTDNGVLQEPELVGLVQIPTNLVLVLDVSESVRGERLDRLREASGAMIGQLRPADRVGLVTVTERVALRVPLTEDRPRIGQALQSLTGGGGTSLRDGTFIGLQLAAAEGEGRSLVVIFTDGVDRSSWLRDEDLVAAGRQVDAVAYAVAVGDEWSPVLKDVTRATGGDVFGASGNQDLRMAFQRVLEEFNSRYLLGYTPRGVPASGWHSLTVRVRRGGATVKARPGYVRAARQP